MEWQVHKETDSVKRWAWGFCAVFCAVSGGGFLLGGDVLSAAICLGTMVLVSLPFLLERCFHCRMSRGFFLFCLLYAMGPMLGKAFKLYYLTNWWDKLLHTSAGFVFAVLGAWLATALNRGKDTTLLLQVLFGVFFSIAVSALWELVEFGVDQWFGGDMQNDTVVHAIHSYLLSEVPGELRSIPQIDSVSLDGIALGVSGYLDIGLIDTMMDVLVETVGAAAFGLWHLADQNRHPMIRMI